MAESLASWQGHHAVPIHIRTIPARISRRSSAFARRLRSLKMSAPQMNDIMTDPRLTRETTEIMESGSPSAVKYAKSAIHMKMDMSGMAQLHLKGVV